MILSTWMYTTPKDDKVLHSQTGRDSDSRRVQDLYWRCVFCLFASSLRANGPLRHLLFVNQLPPASIDGIDLYSLCDRFSIEIVQLDHWTRPPADYCVAWNTQFAILDIIDWLALRADPDDAVLCLDADCIFTRSIGTEIDVKLQRHGALLYTLDYPPDHDINGLTRNQLTALSLEYDPQVKLSEFNYSGGEFFCCRGDQLGRIGRLARAAYAHSLQRYARGLERFREEAQLLSFVYHQLGYETHTANDLIKRIWTQKQTYTNIDGHEDLLPIWHLPAEKQYGFIKMFRELERQDGTLLDHGVLRKFFRLEPASWLNGLADFVHGLR